MNNLEINALAKNPEFRKRIESSIVLAATQISGEDPSGKGANEVAKRHSLATKVLNNSSGNAINFSYAATTQAGLNSVITINEDQSLEYTGEGTLDGDIDFTISSVWDDMSGVLFADKV